MSAMTNTAWRCHARPASLGGKTCGHLNMPGEGIKRDGLACCSECGCTRIAGTDRYARTKQIQSRMWIVQYEASERAAADEHFAPVQITVIASGTDDAYREAGIELGERFLLGHPISAEPVVRV